MQLIQATRPCEDSTHATFWQSHSCIRIECTFGELIMQFGIFWRTLRFDIKLAVNIVNAAGLLHKFILEERDKHKE